VLQVAGTEEHTQERTRQQVALLARHTPLVPAMLAQLVLVAWPVRCVWQPPALLPYAAASPAPFFLASFPASSASLSTSAAALVLQGQVQVRQALSCWMPQLLLWPGLIVLTSVQVEVHEMRVLPPGSPAS
jgi:hypothetical protein